MARKILLILSAILILAGAGGAYYLSTLLRPVSASDVEPVRFVIPKGQAQSVIAQRLADAGLIKHPLVFRLVVRQQGLGSKIQAGSFELSPSQNPFEIARSLTQGTNDIWLTVLEGWRKEEIADAVVKLELPAFDRQAFIDLAAEHEGKLFPDTYLIPREITAESLVSLLTTTFETKVIEGLADEIAASNRDLEDVIIMASLVEREARTFEQMRHVAGILWHRIDIGMALQVDATLQYVRTRQAINGNWWPVPLAADKEIQSPYNTYLNPGLPPRPISNPSLNAIKATLDPLPTKDKFYIHDSSGTMHFAETLEQHNANVNRYLR